jgi:hypothetical protein
MVDTIFSPQYNATENECQRMWSFASNIPFNELKRLVTEQSHDVRWTAIYGLCHLRRDKSGMAHALEQIKDRETVSELTSVDVFSREELERMMRESEA